MWSLTEKMGLSSFGEILLFFMEFCKKLSLKIWEKQLTGKYKSAILTQKEENNSSYVGEIWFRMDRRVS